MNFQQLKIKKFRGLSTHFVVFQELIAYLQSAKNGKGTFMILFNFSKNAVIFKTFYTYQNTSVCLEIPFCKNLYHIEISQLFCSTTQVTGF